MRVGESLAFDSGLTKSMLCTVPSERCSTESDLKYALNCTKFEWGSRPSFRYGCWPRLNISTVLYPVRKSRVFDRGLTKSMHCIVPSQRRGVESLRQGFD